MDRKAQNNILQTIHEDPRSPGAVGSPLMRAESDFGRSQDIGDARFSMNGSAIKPAFSAMNNNNGPNPDVSSALKDLKQNYQHLETAIVENTKRQRLDQIERHKEVLTTLESLKQFLKSEVASRKETEIQFEKLIEQRTNQIAEQFNITYLNTMYEMRDRLKSFAERKAKMEVKSAEIKTFIEQELNQQKEHLIKKIETQQTEFEGAYKQQIADDIRELKYLGELEYNFDNTLNQIKGTRAKEYNEHLQLIDKVVNNTPEIYQKQETTKKLLYQEINRLKTRVKLEVDSRRRADEEIQSALDKYQEVIGREVENKRQEIIEKKKL